MPFDIIEPHKVAPGKVPADAILISTQRSALGAKNPFAKLQFGAAAAEKLGIKAGVKLALAWGTGPDEGKLKVEITQADGHAVKRYREKGALYTTIGTMPGWYSGAIVKRERCFPQYIEATRGGGGAPYAVLRMPRAFVDRVVDLDEQGA